MKLNFLLIFLLFLAFTSHAQETGSDIPDHWCGHVPTEHELQRLAEFQRWYYAEGNTRDIQNEKAFLPMVVHVVRNFDGSGGVSMARVLNLVCDLNAQFDQAGANIFFYLHDVRFINNSTWNSWNGGAYVNLLSGFKDPTALNAYLIGAASTSELCGVYMGGATNPGTPLGFPDVVFMANGCLGANSTTWAHEFGHYLSLPHTFFGWESVTYTCGTTAPATVGGQNRPVQRVDGTNCQNSGDGLCDTGPDYLSFRWQCNAQGLGCNSVDPTGATFNPNGRNFMSYSNDNCQDEFSTDQIQAMHFHINQFRAFMRRTESQFNGMWSGPVTETATLVSPINGKVEPYFNYVEFHWEDVPNATGYVVQLSPLQNFNVIIGEFVSTSSYYALSTQLNQNQTYFWRVKGYNMGSTCGPFSAQGSFITGTAVNTEEIHSNFSVSVLPNPVSSGSELFIQIESRITEAVNVSIYNMAGQKIVSRTDYPIETGNNAIGITTVLPQGVYVVSVETSQGLENERLIVTQ